MRQRPNASDARSWHVVLGALTFLAELVTTGRAWPPAPSPGRLVVEGARQAARSFLQVNLSGVRRRDGGSSLSARGPQLRAGFTPGGHHRAFAGASEPTCDSASTSRLAVAWEHKTTPLGARCGVSARYSKLRHGRRFDHWRIFGLSASSGHLVRSIRAARVSCR